MTNLVALAALAASLTVPAMAQAQQSALIPKQQVVSDYSACVLKRAPERVQALLATEVGSTEERSIAKNLLGNMTSCANGRMFITMRTGEARGALAEAVLKSDAALSKRAEALPAVAIDRPTETEGRRFVMAFARCLAGTSPGMALNLIGTGYDSGEERAAMMAFDGALKDCMPTGLSYQIDIRDVRNHVATALYDRAIAASGGGDTNA